MSRVRFVFHSVSRRSQPEEKLKAIWQIVAVITLQIVRHIVNRELSAETNVDPFPVRQIAHITNRVTGNTKDAIVIDLIEHEFMARLFHPFIARVDRVASALQICLRQDGLRGALTGVEVLRPDERIRPIRIFA